MYPSPRRVFPKIGLYLTLVIGLMWGAAAPPVSVGQESPPTPRQTPRVRKQASPPRTTPQPKTPAPEPESEQPEEGAEVPPLPAPDAPDRVEIPPEVQKKIDEMLQEKSQPAEEPAPVAQPAQKTPQQIAAERAEQRRQARLRAMGQQNDPTTTPPQPGAHLAPNPFAGGGAPSSAGSQGAGNKIEIPASTERATPPEQRKYSFSIKDAGYDVLIEGIARETGLGVIGEAPPDGKVTFVTEEQLTFDQLLDRVRMLLFNYKPLEPYWLLRRTTHLEVIRVNDYLRVMPADRMFRGVPEFRAAALQPSELVLVIFTPTSGALSELNQVRDFMPDYVRVTPLDDQNSVAIYALVSDVEKYLWLVDFFTGRKGDPRKLEIIEVKFITPTEAYEKLQLLMSADASKQPGRAPTMPRARPGGPSPLDGIPAPEVSIVPEDAQGVLIVRAMQDKIDEIKRLLPYVDVNTAINYLPVVIPVRNTDPQALVGTVQQILGTPDSSSGMPVPGGARPRQARRPGGRAAPGASVPVTAADVTLIPHPSISAIIATGPDEAVKRVRELVQLFDVRGQVGPLRIGLVNTDADTAVSTVTQILHGAVPGATTRGVQTGAISVSQVVPDPSGTAIWFTGSEKDLELARQVLADIDVAVEPARLHIVRLVNQRPSFVSTILSQMDSGQLSAMPASTPAGGRGGARRRSVSAPAGQPGSSGGKFTPDDEQGRLFVLCTDAEWEIYRKIIADLEDEKSLREFVLLPVKHIPVDEALNKIAALIPLNATGVAAAPGAVGKEATKIRCETTADGILVLGANETDIQSMRELLAVFDHASDIAERTFEIKFADPAEVKAAVEALLTEGPAATASTVAPRRARSAAPRDPSLGAASSAALTIVQVDTRLIVKASPAVMEQVAAYIEQFDVRADKRTVRVYENFPPGADIEAISSTLSTVLGGSSARGAATPRPSVRQPGTAASGPEGPQFIPQPATGKLIVIAQPFMFEEIEELLNMLRKTEVTEPTLVEYVPIKFADPTEVVESIEPILAVKVRNLIKTGEVTEVMVDESTPAVPRTQRARMPGAAPTHERPYHLAADVRNKRVVVVATRKIIDAAKELIGDFDTRAEVPGVVFEFIEVKHVDPAQLVEQLDPLLALKVQELVRGGELADQADASAPGGMAKGAVRAPGRPLLESRQRYHIAADERNRRIVVAAAQPVVDEARSLVAMFDKPDSKDTRIEVRTVAMQHGDPVEVAEKIEPLLSMKVQQLVYAGELAEEGGITATPGAVTAGRPVRMPRAAGSASKRYHMEPDQRNKQIVIAAPTAVIDEAVKLIAEFDKPSDASKLVFETVVLHNADPNDMVKTIKEMIGAPQRAVTQRGRPGAPAAPVPEAILTSSLAIAAAPGGGAVVLQGPADEVAQARDWVERLDAMATSGRQIKIYEVKYADTETLVDIIMNVVDTAGREPAKRAALPRGLGKESDDEDVFKTSVTRVGKDVYIKADLIADTMVVVAGPAKIAEVDAIVAQMDTKESEEATKKPVVPRIYIDLEFASSFDASDALGAILKDRWESSEDRPKVTTGLFGETLIVSHPDEARLEEVRELVATLVDKPDPKKFRETRRTITSPSNIPPRDLIMMLQLNNPDIEFEMIDGTPPDEDKFIIERVKAQPPPAAGKPQAEGRRPAPAGSPQANAGSVLIPVPLRAAATAALCAALAQVPEGAEPEEVPPPEEEEEIEPEPELSQAQLDAMLRQAQEALIRQGVQPKETPDKKKGDGEKSEEQERGKSIGKEFKGQKIKAVIDRKTGAVTLIGPEGVVEQIPDLIKEVEEQLKDAPAPPDIRIYRVRYIDVITAQDILEEMFNATRQQMAQVQAAQRQAQQMAIQQQRQAQLQQQRQQQQERGGEGQQPGRQPQQPQPVPIPELPATAVRVYPNPRDRTLILRADTNQYPAIEELLATIDQPKPYDNLYRVIPLKKLNATDVEALLRDWLGLDESKARTGARGPRGASPEVSGAGGQLPKTIVQETKTGVVELGVDPQDIKISSNLETNSILVMAPQAALDYIEELITDLESQDVAEREWKSYQLLHADVEEVADYLATRINQGRPGASTARPKGAAGKAPEGGTSLNTASFIPYPRLQMLSVQATAEQIAEVDKLIVELDVPAAGENFLTVVLAHADAKLVADTLDSMFGSGGAARGGRGAAPTASVAAKFIGEEGGRVVFFSAPERLHERIHGVIKDIEEQSEGRDQLRVIQLQYARASTVADAIDSAYGAGRRTGAARGRGAQGGGAARVTVTASDATRQLFVMTDDATFNEVESLVKSLDTERGIGFDFRIYPLRHADARAVFTTMNKLITDYLRRLPPQTPIDPFSVEVDDKANALVVLGSPTIFGFVEDSLKTIDTPANAPSPPGVLMVVLKTADATEVAQNINRLWSTKIKEGEVPPTAEANRTLNMVIVRGTQKQIDDIRSQVIDPLEQQAAAQLLTETITLQHALAEDVAESLTRIFDDKRKALQTTGGRGPGGAASPLDLAVVVTPLVNTNQVVVQANEANLGFIKERIAQLDLPEFADTAVTSTKVYAAAAADPNAVVNMIREWSRTQQQTAGANRKVSAKDVIVAVADPLTQTVIVTASEANHQRVREMIDGLDAESGDVKPTVRTIKIKYADAYAIQEAIGKLFRGDGRNPREQVIATADANSNSVVVSASADNLRRVEELIATLDAPDAAQRDVQVIRLENADATAVAKTLDEIFVKSAPKSAGAQAPPISISALEGSRAVVVKSKPEDFARIEAAAKAMDSRDTLADAPKIILLQHARADQIAHMLQQTFEQQRGGGRAGKAPPTVVANEQINGLVVRAEPADLAGIESLVAQLDSDKIPPQSRFKIIQLEAGVNLADLAEKVELTINEAAKAQVPPGSRQPPSSITVTSDARTGVLIVGGSPSLFADAEEMARTMVTLGPTGNTVTSIFKPQNVAVEDIQRLIDQLTNPTAEGDGTRRGGAGGTRGGTTRPTTRPRPRTTPQR